MRVLITGANGYIGGSLVKALSAFEEVFTVVPVTRQELDLTDSFAVTKFFAKSGYFDVVVHCAAVGGSRLQKDDWTVLDKNLTMYYNLLYVRERFGRLIHFGSGAETYMPKEPYGYSKKIIAKSILNHEDFYNIKIFGVFDENELETRFIKASINRYIKKEAIVIHQEKLMDFFYMEDLIKVIKFYTIVQDPPKEFDCVYGPVPTDLGSIADIINQLGDYKVPVEYGTQGLDVYASQYRTTVLPIQFVGLDEGLKNTYNILKNETS